MLPTLQISHRLNFDLQSGSVALLRGSFSYGEIDMKVTWKIFKKKLIRGMVVAEALTPTKYSTRSHLSLC